MLDIKWISRDGEKTYPINIQTQSQKVKLTSIKQQSIELPVMD